MYEGAVEVLGEVSFDATHGFPLAPALTDASGGSLEAQALHQVAEHDGPCDGADMTCAEPRDPFASRLYNKDVVGLARPEGYQQTESALT